MKEIRFGAIDVGSNAARLLITSITGLGEGNEIYYKKAALVRVPLRLGFDAFVNNELSKRSINRLTHTMQAYFHTMKAYEVVNYRACATSAMRETKNSAAIIKTIKEKSGLNLEVLPGHSEARILYNTQITEKLNKDRPYLYIDVGGGSTEISIFNKGDIKASRSFKIGTIRLLNGLVSVDRWIEMQDWVTQQTEKYSNLAGIGTGGNISKIFKITKKAKNTPLSLFEIEGLYRELEPLSLQDRIRKYDMKTDRADVIVPAANIFRNIMNWSNCEEVFVPKIGLADGITRMLFQEYQEKQKNKTKK